MVGIRSPPITKNKLKKLIMETNYEIELSKFRKENVEILFDEAYEILWEKVFGENELSHTEQEFYAVQAYAMLMNEHGSEDEAEALVGSDLVFHIKERVVNCIYDCLASGNK